jgi:hypothetical protein
MHMSSTQSRKGNMHKQIKTIVNMRWTWASTPLHEETCESNFPEAIRPKANLTDLSMGKTEPSPALSRLQISEKICERFFLQITSIINADSTTPTWTVSNNNIGILTGNITPLFQTSHCQEILCNNPFLK